MLKRSLQNCFFCPTNSPKPKCSSFSFINNKEKQQILTFKKHLTNRLLDESTNHCSTVPQFHPIPLSKLISVFQLVNHPSLHLPAVPDNYWPLIRWLKWKQAAVSPEGKDNELMPFQAIQFLCIMKYSIVLIVTSEGLKCFTTIHQAQMLTSAQM